MKYETRLIRLMTKREYVIRSDDKVRGRSRARKAVQLLHVVGGIHTVHFCFDSLLHATDSMKIQTFVLPALLLGSTVAFSSVRHAVLR